MKLNIFENHKPSLYAFPQSATQEEYEVVIQESVTKIKAVPGVTSIYQFGSVSHPGISDIDLIVVVDDNIVGKQLTKELNYLLKKHSFFFEHYPFVMPKKVMQNISLIFPVSNMKPLWGEEIELIQHDEETLKLINFVDLSNYCFSNEILKKIFKNKYEPNKIKRVVKKILNTGKKQVNLEVKNLLCRLHSMRFAFDFIKAHSKHARDYDAFVKEIRVLREDWHKLKEQDRNEKLFDLVNRCVLLDYRFIYDLQDYVIKKQIFEPIQLTSKKEIDIYGRRVYKQGLSFDDALSAHVNSAHVKVTGYLPAIFYNHIQYYKGGMVKFKDKKYEALLEKRKKIIFEHFEFLNKNKLYFGQMFFINEYQFNKPLTKLAYKVCKTFDIPIE